MIFSLPIRRLVRTKYRGGHVQRADAAAVIGEITAVLNAQQICQHIVHTAGVQNSFYKREFLGTGY
ncbi:hypothetical protein, partial [Akkermansia sp.]|uniref:hypothetical protein n=1 Tax=Akkermansia sp. TaxID=1872421 RepID=UPI003AB2521E